MEREFILYPLFVMVALSFYVTWRLGKQRVQAVLKDGISSHYFHYNQGNEQLPNYLLRTEQHYVNLFEQPVLFYAAILLAYSASITDVVLLGLAWAFAISRIIHAYIHLVHNKLRNRRRAFIYSTYILIVLWLYLFIYISVYNSVA